MSNRLGGFIAGQNISVAIGTFTAVTSPTFTFASTQATPSVGQAVQFTTTGTLPTGLSINTNYYVISTSTNTCQFSTTLGGSAITFTNSSGSGTHTAVTQRAFNLYAGAPDTVEYLIVAGGGSSSGINNNNNGNGGGGAGGLLTAIGYAVTPGSAITVTVGAGGAAGGTNAIGNNGGNSVFGSITATGGGYGGNGTTGNGGNGGSGGGSYALQAGAGLGTSGQGNNGGNSYQNGSGGGGGGGAGSAGNSYISSISFSLGGNGGTGICSTITGTRQFYAGGGAGGVVSYPYSNDYDYNAVSLGGAGGGGNSGGASSGSQAIYYPQNGKSNTGGGAGAPGGSNSSSYTNYGASGGSGIVIIRYPQINSAPALVTGSPQVSYADGYQIYTWTSSGSITF
jgi:hypothetical protein